MFFSLREQINCEREICQTYFVRACVKMILDTHEILLQEFRKEFLRISPADEKNDCLNNFLRQLYRSIDNQNLLHNFSDKQMEMVQIAIEQSAMTAVYIPALFPNGDGDKDRDKLVFITKFRVTFCTINLIFLEFCTIIYANFPTLLRLVTSIY